MRGYRLCLPTGRTIQRLTVWLMLLSVVAGCDLLASPVPAPPTPLSTPAPSATSTTPPAPTASVETAATPTTKPSPAAGEGWARTIRWRGEERFLLGVNYPYHRYGNDFGANAWGSYGVHDPDTYAQVDADFAEMASLGVQTVRWFVFADGRAGITYDEAGLPSGIDEFVIPDFDAALEIAQRHSIALNFVLLDFRFLWDARMENGVQLGGRSSVLATPAGQQALVRKIFEPVFRRYADHPAILSWEVMNEPEWAILDAGSVDRQVIREPHTLATFRAFAQLVVDAIHNVARSYATIGCADMKWARNWVGLGLDYYQIHFYDWMKAYSTDNLFAVHAESLRLDRPVVVGEFPAERSSVAELSGYLDTWYMNGYAGAWPWSFRSDIDSAASMPDLTPMRAWAEAHRAATGMPAIPTPASQVLTYTVEGGDSLSLIAVRFGTTPEAIMEANSLTSSVIRPGQILAIPASRGAGTPSTTPGRP